MAKSNQAITLVALVITIIILIILSGISINLILGNNGLITRAKQAKNEYINAQIAEKEALNVLKEEFSKDIKLINSITLNKATTVMEIETQETLIATVLPSDADNKNLKWESSNTNIATVDENGTITTLSDGEVIITATAKDGSNKSAKCSIKVVDEIIIYYYPDSSNTSEVPTANSGYNVQNLAVSNTNWNINTWKILQKNEDGTLDLISANPTIGKLYLKGANGYNNGVYTLNKICNDLYGNGTNITGRSIKIEDIMDYTKGVSGNAITAREKYDEYAKEFNVSNGSYMKAIKNYCFPNLYKEEIGYNQQTEGLDMSEQNSIVTGTFASNVYLKFNIWQKTMNKTDFIGKTEKKQENYYNKFMNPSTNYWVASRTVTIVNSDTLGYYADFGMRIINGENISYERALWRSTNSSGLDTPSVQQGQAFERQHAIRPIIHLNNDVIIQDNNDGTMTVIQ